MNLKDYIKSINQFLINEDFDEGTEENMQAKVTKLQELQAKLAEFIKKLEASQLTLEQVAAAAGQSANQNTAQPVQQPQPAPAQAQPSQPAAPPAQPAQSAAQPTA